MSEARTFWHDMAGTRTDAVGRQRSGIVLAIVLLCAMAAVEVLFLRYVAGPDSVNLISAAEGIPTTD